uniref:Leucine-rich repeat-containing protein 70 n=1 Tax=Anoplophora glabripennis TaxID=217634 RepID=V5I8Y4_ANOGL
MKKFIVIYTFLICSILADEIYENSKDICERCKCRDEDEFLLDCTDQGFKYILANWPAHNKTLVATFSYNNITTLEILPPTNQTVRLVFDHCNIKYLDPGAFKEVKNVEFIDLSYNLLTTEEIDGEDFKGPYNKSVYCPIAVKHLNLAYNQIHSLPRKFFESMPYLEELNLAGNDFVTLDPNTQMALATLPNLRVLNLASNDLTDLDGDAIKSLNKLVELNLSSNHLDFVPETLDYLGKHLKVLDLSDNFIFELRDGSFLGVTSITELYLDDLPRLTTIYVDTFANLPNLRKLSLRNNVNLMTIDREAFGINQTLEELYLTNNSLAELDYRLLPWSKLRVFELRDNLLECDCNLYNISRDLDASITRERDGPVCVDPRTDNIREVYALSQDICGVKSKRNLIGHAIRHFETLRVVLITLSCMFTLATFIALTVAFLRYRRGTAFRSYNFTTQVQYNPLQTQFRI